MEKLEFDSGIREYRIGNAGVLRFNPHDPNVYARFMDSMESIQAVQERLVAKAKTLEGEHGPENSGKAVLAIMAEADREIKAILSGIFGGDNDFDEILGGVNLLAIAGNGQTVVTNLLNALEPVMVSGAQACAKRQAGDAVAAAKKNRAQRRAGKRKHR
jgi:hypothetical protein